MGRRKESHLAGFSANAALRKLTQSVGQTPHPSGKERARAKHRWPYFLSCQSCHRIIRLAPTLALTLYAVNTFFLHVTLGLDST